MLVKVHAVVGAGFQPALAALKGPPYVLLFVALWLARATVAAQPPDEATRLLREYVAIDTSNPPGDTRKAADFLARCSNATAFR